MRKQRKSQAALEFLMTYGWAILVVLVAIGALAYFGVLSPDKFLPSKCTLPAGVACVDHKITGHATAGTVTIVLRNALGSSISSVDVSVKDSNDDETTICAEGTAAATIQNGDQGTVVSGSCGALVGGARFSGDLVVAYTNDDSGLSKSIRGSITGTVE